jgi:hypothetical protein
LAANPNKQPFIEVGAIIPPDRFLLDPDGWRFALALYILFWIRPELVLNSWFRSPVENDASGGVRNSLHLEGQAADVDWLGADRKRLQEIAELYLDICSALGLNAGAIVYWGQGKSYLHLQSRRLISGSALTIVT